MSQIKFGRRLLIDPQLYTVKPGDQVDTSPDLEPLWCTVERVGLHPDDTANEDRCPGGCVLVFFFVHGDDCPPLHVRAGAELFTRFPLGGDVR